MLLLAFSVSARSPDVNSDRCLDVQDLTIIALNKGKAAPIQADINEDGVINDKDYAIAENLWLNAKFSGNAKCQGYSCEQHDECNGLDGNCDGIVDKDCYANGYISVAAAKYRYQVGDKIELTESTATNTDAASKINPNNPAISKKTQNGVNAITGNAVYNPAQPSNRNEDYSSQGIAAQNSAPFSDKFPNSKNAPQSKGYIVQFKEPSILEKRAELQKLGLPEKTINEKLNEQKQTIEKEHSLAKTKIADITSKITAKATSPEIPKKKSYSFKVISTLGGILIIVILFLIIHQRGGKKSSRGKSSWGIYLLFLSVIFLALLSLWLSSNRITGYAVQSATLSNLKAVTLNEFSTAFNGIALDISEKEAEAIGKLPEVKKVYPNLIVNITLMDSVPLIKADKVWELDKDGNKCSETGKECLTGKGIKIGIIDTGVDYTHPDLGGCFGSGPEKSISNEFLIQSPSNRLELSEDISQGTNRETLSDAASVMGAKELDALASGTVDNRGIVISYDQSLSFVQNANKDSGYVSYLENVNNDKTSDFLFFKSGREIARYELYFNSAFTSDIDSSGTLKDFVSKKLNIFGKEYTITTASKTENGVVLVLSETAGAHKIELKDTDITDVGSSNALKVDDSTIEDALVIIVGEISDVEVRIQKFTVIMNADDNFFVPPQGSLSETIKKNNGKPQVLFTQNWDMQYRGLSQSSIENLVLKPNGLNQYNFEFVDGNKNTVSFPIANLNNKFINTENKIIEKGTYFLVTDSTRKSGDRKTFILQYKGADKVSSDNPALIFRDLGSGETIQQNYSDSTPLAALKIGGSSFNIYKAPNADINSNDFSVQIDLDGDGVFTDRLMPIISYFGAEIFLSNKTNNKVDFNIRTPSEATENLKASDITGYIAPSGNQLQLDYNGNVNLRTPSDQNNIAYGYTSYGSFITYSTPANSQASLQINYPQQQLSPLVYVVTGGIAASSSKAFSGKPRSSAVRPESADFTESKINQLTTRRQELYEIDDILTFFNKTASFVQSVDVHTKIPSYDLDEDGKKEFILREGNYYTASTYGVYESQGDNIFSRVHELPISGVSYSFLGDAGDSDSDGLSEMLIIARVSSPFNARLYESTLPNHYPSNLVWSMDFNRFVLTAKIDDMDKDGKKEIIFALNNEFVPPYTNSPLIAVYENSGNNAYTNVYNVVPSSNPQIQSFDICDDLDNDGKTEFIAGSYGQFDIFENTGDDAYSRIWIGNLTASDYDPINKINSNNVKCIGDTDGDGKKEFIIGGMRTNKYPDSTYYDYYKIFEAVSDNNFKEISSIKLKRPSSSSGSSVNFGDLDGDGNNDLFFTVQSDKTYVFKSTGNDMFEQIWYHDAPVPSSVAIYNSNTGAGDLDNDSKGEIIFNEYVNGAVNTVIYEYASQGNTSQLVENCELIGDEDNNGFADCQDTIACSSGTFCDALHTKKCQNKQCVIVSQQNQSCKVIDGYDFVNKDNDPMDDQGHGTHVAATAAGNGALKGVAPDASIVAYKVLDSSGSGSFDNVIAAIERSVDPNQDGDYSDKLDAISLSLGGFGDPDDPPSQAIDNVVDAGIVAVIAAGNDGPSPQTIGSPGTARNAITVGAVYKKDYEGNFWQDNNPKADQITSFSSRGPVIWEGGAIIKPDIVAPGAIICAAGKFFIDEGQDIANQLRCVDEEHIAISGTSMATPHVSGAVALIKQAHPDWKPIEIKMALRSTAIDINESINTQGYGRIDVLKSAGIKNKPPIAKLDTSGLLNGFVDIIGTATGDNFRQFTLYLGESLSPKQWTVLQTSKIPVENGILFKNFDPAVFTDGQHILRLAVENTDGQISEDMSIIIVDNVILSYPLNNDIFRLGDTIDINGTISVSGSYIIEYGKHGKEGYPQEWFSLGIVLGNSAHGPKINEKLAVFNTAFLKESGFYTLRLTVYKSDKQIQEYIQNIYIDSTLRKGWPQRFEFEREFTDNSQSFVSASKYFTPILPQTYQNTEQSSNGRIKTFTKNEIKQKISSQTVSINSVSYVWPGYLVPVVSDINNDGKKEIIIYKGGVPQKIFVFNDDGSLLWSKPVGTTNASGGNIVPLVDDLNNDGMQEIIVYDINSNSPDTSKVYVFDHDGNILQGFPAPVPQDFHPSMLTADLDLDGNKEIVIKGNDYWGEKLVILSKQGQIISQWNLTDSSWSADIMSSPAVGNFDDDPQLEIVVASPSQNAGYNWEKQEWINEGIIDVYNIDGTHVNGWPVIVPGEPFSSPAVGDINNDGKLDIIIGLLYTTDNFPDERYGGLYAFDSNGKLLPGWPVEKGWNFWSSPSLADFNKDGKLEIAASRLGFVTYIFNYDGSIANGWPQYTAWNDYYSTVIGDVNGDKKPDVVTTAGDGFFPFIENHGGVYAWNFDGTLIEGFPKVTEVDAQAPATIANIDNDGKVEIVASSDWDFDLTTSQEKRRGALYVWNLDSALNEDTMYWPTFQHDEQRTGLFSLPKISNSKPSKIQNAGNSSLEGYLIMKVQNEIDGQWNDVKIIVDDKKQPRIIPANDSLPLESIWKDSGSYTAEIPGKFRIYAALRDVDGDVIKTTDGKQFEDNYPFNVDVFHLNCEISSKNCKESKVLSLADLNDGHVSLGNNFQFNLCCNKKLNLQDKGSFLFKISDPVDDAHISLFDTSGFPKSIDLSSYEGDGLQCTVRSDCSVEEACLFSVLHPFDDAHVRSCGNSIGSYDKLCCKLAKGGIDVMPPIVMANYENGKIDVLTNEYADCRYGDKNLPYDKLPIGIPCSDSNCIAHSVHLSNPNIYIKCSDKNNNAMDESVKSILEKTNILCRDSDNGKNYFVQGTTSNELGKTYSDYCMEDGSPSNFLKEYYCGINGEISSTEYLCPDGCQDGACISKDVCNAENNNNNKESAKKLNEKSSNSFSLMVNPANSKNSRLSLSFDEKLGVNTKALAKEMSNIVSYGKNDITLGLNENANPFLLSKSGQGEVKQESFDGYIVELKEMPVLEKKKLMEKEIKEGKDKIKKLNAATGIRSLLNYPLKLYTELKLRSAENNFDNNLKKQDGLVNDEHNVVRREISNKIDREFKKTFNGFSLKSISEQDAKKIKNLKQVKKISPNYQVKTSLKDSVPLIKANEVWELDKDGNKCSETGKECLTGKGIKIGIIDTGVDYTHADLCYNNQEEKNQKSGKTAVTGSSPFTKTNSVGAKSIAPQGIVSAQKEKSQPWLNFKQSYGNSWNVLWDRNSNRPARISGFNIPALEFGSANVNANNAAQLGKAFLAKNKALFNIDANSLEAIGVNTGPKMYPSQNNGLVQATYQQKYNNIPVFKSYISIAFINNKLVSYDAKYYDIKDVDLSASVSRLNAVENAKNRFNISDSSIVFEPDMVIYPLESRDAIDYRLSYKIDLPLVQNPLSQMTVFVDAKSGEILDSYDNIRYNVIGNVKGNILPEHANQSFVEEPFAHEYITINDAIIQTDTNGEYFFPSSLGSNNLSSELSGHYVQVFNAQNKINYNNIYLMKLNDQRNNLYLTDYGKGIAVRIDLSSGAFTKLPFPPEFYPWVFELDEVGNRLYIVKCSSGSGVGWCYPPKRIFSTDLEGTDEQVVAESKDTPVKIAFDTLHNAVYWIEHVWDGNTYSTNSTVYRFALNASDSEPILKFTARWELDDIVVSEDSIYLSSSINNTVWRANLDGTNFIPLVSIRSPRSLKYNPADKKLYFINYNKTMESNLFISSMSTDGSNLSNVVSIKEMPYPYDFELDSTTNAILILNRNGIFRINPHSGESIKVSVATGALRHNTLLNSSSVHNWNWDADDNSDRNEESNVFYHTNVVHDFFNNIGAHDTDLQFTATVNLPRSCNAYYVQNSINFFQQSSQCENTALLSDVIYHEYTHGVTDNIITIPFPYRDQTGNLNEAWSDYFGVTINNNPCMAEGFFKAGPLCLRNAENTNKWPEDYSPEPHSGAPIITGALWDLRKELGADIVDKLTIQAMRLQPNSFAAFLENVIIADDDNQDLSDGTPHLENICAAFGANHGVYSTHCPAPQSKCFACKDCKVIDGYDFVNKDNDPMDDQGHGTHVAATAAGNGALKGVAPDASIVAYKVLDSGGSGWFDDVIAAIERSADPNQDGDYSDKLDVISLSLGARCFRYDENCGPDDPVSTAIDNAVGNGVVAVIAAGNSGPDPATIGSPGTARKAITVGATDKSENLADFSSRDPVIWSGGYLLKPDIVAPGVDICAAQSSQDKLWQMIKDYRNIDSHCIDDKHISISGTSMATPHISGASALLKQAHPDWSPDDIKSALILNTKELGLNANEQGSGFADVLRASQAKILLSPSQINLGNIIDTLPEAQKITIKNNGKEDITLSIHSDCSSANLKDEEITVNAGSSADVFFSLVDIPDSQGSIKGTIRISDGSNSYKLPYLFNSFSQVNLIVDTGEGQSDSDIAIVNDELSSVDYKFGVHNQDSFLVPAGNHIFYASGNVVDFSKKEYLLMKSVDVPKHKRIDVALSTKDAKPFRVKAKSLDGTNLLLYQWQKAFKTYNDKGCYLNYYLTDPNYGDRTVYISNRPSEKSDTDVFFKYEGVPSKTAVDGGGGSGRGFSWNLFC